MPLSHNSHIFRQFPPTPKLGSKQQGQKVQQPVPIFKLKSFRRSQIF